MVDCIDEFEKIGGLEELLRCLILVPALDGDKLLEALETYGFGQLYQKTGFILEVFKDEISLPDTFFAECEKKSSASKTYLYERQECFVLHERWKLFAPEDLRIIIDKGVTDYDAVWPYCAWKAGEGIHVLYFTTNRRGTAFPEVIVRGGLLAGVAFRRGSHCKQAKGTSYPVLCISLTSSVREISFILKQ